MQEKDINKIKQILNNPKDIAFVIGNGIHRHIDEVNCSWKNFLSRTFNDSNLNIPNEGLTYTEFYDIMSINTRRTSDSIKSNICDDSKKYFNCYEACADDVAFQSIINKIKAFEAPIITTNFDLSIEHYANLNPYHDKSNFSPYYPWSEYFADRADSPFRVWHMHGSRNRYRSLRLGLTDYAGAIEKARKLIFEDKTDSLFYGKRQSYWPGHNTWLHLIFNKSLFIFGIGLEEQEILLRWLLIVRKSYFEKIGDSDCKGWYICCNDNNHQDMNEGKKLFFESVGIKPFVLNDRKDVMKKIWE